MSVLARSRTVVCTDVVGSSSGEPFRRKHLDDMHRTVVQRAIDASSRYPVAGSFLRVDGDSMTMVVDADVPRSWLLADFLMREVVLALKEVNQVSSADCRLRLRAAIDHGETVLRPPNVEGDPVTRTARMRDSAALRGVMAEATTPLGLIVSGSFYAEVVARRERDLDPDRFTAVQVTEKQFAEEAWLWLADGQVPPRATPAGGRASGTNGGTNGGMNGGMNITAGAITVIDGPVTMTSPVFGSQYGA